MIVAIVVNRRRNYSIWGRSHSRTSYINEAHSPDPLLANRDDDEQSTSSSYLYLDSKHAGKRRSCLGLALYTPNSSRFADNLHSRILQKFPFIVEMFYWALNYVAYRFTKDVATMLYHGGNEVTQLAQDHGINILDFEHHSIVSPLFLEEASVQKFFIDNHQSILTFLNRIYSLVHIPGTVAFLSWYYYAAPNHTTFAVARRTMTLGNFAAFIIFCFYPCMPPRLLPKSFGFQDTVRQDHAESVWVGDGKNVNQLAAMPSLHFTYAFVIGTTFLYHSGLIPHTFQRSLRMAQRQRSATKAIINQSIWAILAIAYPVLVLMVIVVTANHYWLDAVVATFSVSLSYLCNKVWLGLLPCEDLLLWALRMEKPVPTTGRQWCGNAAVEARGRDREENAGFV